MTVYMQSVLCDDAWPCCRLILTEDGEVYDRIECRFRATVEDRYFNVALVTGE